LQPVALLVRTLLIDLTGNDFEAAMLAASFISNQLRNVA
jgi:hypothetical protein